MNTIKEKLERIFRPYSTGYDAGFNSGLYTGGVMARRNLERIVEDLNKDAVITTTVPAATLEHIVQIVEHRHNRK